MNRHRMRLSPGDPLSRAVVLVLLLAGLGSVRAAEPAGTSNANPGWKLVWSDEFDTPGLPDPTRWTYENGFIRNNELQYYTAARHENARVENGLLVIEARREPWPNPDFKPSADGARRSFRERLAQAEYTSASLTTLGRASWTFGRIEVKAKLPSARGTWPAIWMLGTNMTQVGWPACGEIDIMEFVGYDPDVVHANIHTKAYNHVQGTGKGRSTPLPGASTAFHIYAVEWNAQELRFEVDGRTYFTFANEGTGPAAWPFDRDHYLILNLAIGGDWGGRKGIDAAAFPQRYEIDFVRVFQATK